MRRKMEDLARELGEELEELFAFVKKKFLEIVEGLGKPKPEIPDFDIDVKFILKQKAFVKTLLDFQRKEGKENYEWHPKNLPDSKLGATTVVLRDRPMYILVNCSRIRTWASKLKIDLKENMTRVIIHEMIHTLEIITDINILRSTILEDDGFTLPIYEAWARTKT